MASIIAKDVGLLFPFIGSDRKFGSRLSKRGEGRIQVGGRIVTGKSGSGVQAIEGLNLSLKDGDRLGIYGHNGAGKTTLLRVLAGIYPATSGELSINGRVSGLFSLGLGINKEVSGLENITLKGMMYGLKRCYIQELIPEIVEFSELSDYVHMPFKTYSAGMALRLQFSIASALRPDILLMDEWVSSADRAFKLKMDKKLEEMISETPIVIIASHAEERLANWANQVIIMENGRVVESRDTTDYVARTNFKADAEDVAHYNKLINYGRKEEAYILIDEIWPVSSDPIANTSRKATHLMREGKFKESALVYQKLLSLAPEEPKFLDQYGRLSLKIGNSAQAVDYLTRALTASNGQIGSIPALRKACEALGDIERANEILEQIDREKRIEINS